MEHDGDSALALVCAELNFHHSLVQDAWELREHVVAALTRSADALEYLSVALRRRAGLRPSGEDRDRLLATADRMRLRAEATRRRCEDLAARPLGSPRSGSSADSDAVSS